MQTIPACVLTCVDLLEILDTRYYAGSAGSTAVYCYRNGEKRAINRKADRLVKPLKVQIFALEELLRKPRCQCEQFPTASKGF